VNLCLCEIFQLASCALGIILFLGGCDTVWFGKKLVVLGSAQLDE